MSRAVALVALLAGSSALASHTAPPNGRAVYGVPGNSTPQTRVYLAGTDLFGAPLATLAGAGPVVVKSVAAPGRAESLAGYVDSGGTLRVVRWNGLTWTLEWSVVVGGNGTNGRRFDLAYENGSSDAIVLYSNNTAGANELRYRVWNGSTWTPATALNLVRLGGTPLWVKLEVRAGTDELAALVSDTSSDLTAVIWNGAAWGGEPGAALSTSLYNIGAAGDAESFDLAYESLSGDLLMVWGNASWRSSGVRYATRSAAGGWSGVLTPPAFADNTTNVDLASAPNSDSILFASVDDASADLQAGVWDGAAWVNNTANLDLTCEPPVAGSRRVAAGWLVSGATTRGVVMYADAASAAVGWYVYTPGTGFALQADFAPTPSIGTGRQLNVSQDPLNRNRLMLTFSDANSALWAKRLSMDATAVFSWSNTEGGAALSATLTGLSAQAFSFAYDRFNPTTTLANGVDAADTTLCPGAVSFSISM